jgi:glycosyltransferase involved in cell wall biosynthesis
MPAVSVVVPNYNHARFLRQRIDSILAQTFQDFEVILLDDCSTDDSRDILREYASDSRVRLDFNEQNSGGTYKQWNKGVRVARGEYVWIAESDDYADLRFLEKLVALLDGDASLGLVFCRSWRVSEDGKLDGFVDSDLADNLRRWTSDFVASGCEMCREYFARGNAIPNASAVLFQKQLFERIGGADETLRTCGDWKAWAGIALQGRIGYVCEPLNYFRFHAASVRTQSVSARFDVEEHLRVCNWVIEQSPVPEPELEKIRESVAGYWVAALLSLNTPSKTRRAIFQNARRLDPHPVRRMIRPALATVGRKLSRHWHDLRSDPAANQR